MGTLDLERAPPASSRAKHDDLLCTPMDTSTQEDSFQRASASYQFQGQRFIMAGGRSFERQYAQLYFARLMQLQGVVRERVQQEWLGVRVVPILDVDVDSGTSSEVAVIGTIYKDMKLKPSILDEYAKDRGLQQALGGATNFCSDGDGLVLEDEGARMVLRDGGAGALDEDALVTGVVLAVRGRAEPGGDFLVSAVCCAGLPPQAPRSVPEQDVYVALVSGLQLADPKTDALQVQLLVDFLTGNLGSPAQQELASKVAHLIIAGGTVGVLEALATTQAYGKQQARALQPVKDMDMVMTELAAALPVDLMPGADDPANVSLPQQPLHRCLFPGAAPYDSFSRVPNPHACALAGGALLLGSSGQNVSDMAKYCREEDRLALMEHTLRWRHLAPTAPDTLTCYPFTDADPFVVQECPHVYFVGCQPAFATRMIEGDGGQRVRLVAVPSFSKTGTLVLLNLRTLQCQPICFDTKYGQR